MAVADFIAGLQAAHPALAAPLGEMLVRNACWRGGRPEIVRRAWRGPLGDSDADRLRPHVCLQELYDRKLWHELTLKLEDAVTVPEFKKVGQGRQRASRPG